MFYYGQIGYFVTTYKNGTEIALRDPKSGFNLIHKKNIILFYRYYYYYSLLILPNGTPRIFLLFLLNYICLYQKQKRIFSLYSVLQPPEHERYLNVTFFIIGVWHTYEQIYECSHQCEMLRNYWGLLVSSCWNDIYAKRIIRVYRRMPRRIKETKWKIE